MAINVSREKLLFYAAAGALGGFGAWGAAEPFMGVQNVYLRDLLLGAMVGLFIAGFLAAIEALCVSQWRQAARGAQSGVIIGGIGGMVGLLVAELMRCQYIEQRALRLDRQRVKSGPAGDTQLIESL